jgi:hypothetical protein
MAAAINADSHRAGGGEDVGRAQRRGNSGEME